MSTATALPPPSTLVGRKLPRWTPVALVAGALAIAGVLAVLGPATASRDSSCGRGPVPDRQTIASFAVEGGRHARDRLVTSLIYTSFVITVIPLVRIDSDDRNGLARFDSSFFSTSLRNISATNAGGGAYHALVGTIEQVLFATLFAVPIGIFVAIYLGSIGQRPFARAVSTFVDVMTGLPSIVAGLFIYHFWVLAPATGLFRLRRVAGLWRS